VDLDLQGKTALVTGGSRGIGRAIARELAVSGCTVVIFARNEESLMAAAKDISRESGGTVVGVTTDVRDTDEVDRGVKTAARILGDRIDILVNNAAAPGGLAGGPLVGISDDDVLTDLDTKVVGYLRCARAVAPYMVASGWGRIVNIGGNSARSPGTNLSAGMRNAAVVTMTKYLADQLGPAGVTVNVVHPGATWTERSEVMYAEQAMRAGVSIDDIKSRVGGRNSIKRIVDAAEVAYVVTFLASPRSGAINGEVISAGGGAGDAVYY
jgi:NAD(P)-dependent dehydrogenase (short-subunit alcohol dehydrogenase family)